MLDCFLHHVYPFVPVIEPTVLQANYECGQLPTFLLYAMFVTALSSFSTELVLSTGYTDITTAQIEFFTRAKLIYDCGYEQSELICLQASVLLGSFQHSFDSTKNSRFWFANAVRLAKQMGLHRRHVLPPHRCSTHH